MLKLGIDGAATKLARILPVLVIVSEICPDSFTIVTIGRSMTANALGVQMKLPQPVSVQQCRTGIEYLAVLRQIELVSGPVSC